MKINEIVTHFEAFAPINLQEVYDNSGLLTGDSEWTCTGVLCTIDVTEAIIQEAVERNCNLVVAHHPIIFKGLNTQLYHKYF